MYKNTRKFPYVESKWMDSFREKQLVQILFLENKIKKVSLSSIS